MQLVVEAAGVADGLAVVVPPPEGGVGGAAVGAGHPHAPVSVRGLFRHIRNHKYLQLF